MAGQVVWVRVEGKGSFLNSSGLKDFTKVMLERGHREFAVDLRRCTVMDSTFMGTLAMIALRLRELGGGHLHVLNLNERNKELLSNLGLDLLFTREECPALNGAKVETTPLPQQGGAGREAKEKTMLEAHEALVEADPENLAKFKDVLEFLKQDLKVSE